MTDNHIGHIALPEVCPACGALGGAAWQVSSTPGPSPEGAFVPYLRCAGCQQIYGYDRYGAVWALAIGRHLARLVFLPLDKLPTYARRWQQRVLIPDA